MKKIRMEYLASIGLMALATTTIIEHGSYAWGEIWKLVLLTGMMLVGIKGMMEGADESHPGRTE